MIDTSYNFNGRSSVYISLDSPVLALDQADSPEFQVKSGSIVSITSVSPPDAQKIHILNIFKLKIYILSNCK